MSIMVVILVNQAWPGEQTLKSPLTEGAIWNLVKNGQVDSKKTLFYNNVIL